jgi:hypothetical protein
MGATTALVAWACVKADVTPQPISFAPVTSKATKAIIEGSTYPADVPFVVSAFYNGTTTYFQNLTATKAVMGWETSPSEYWPLQGSLVFQAYSPASAGLSLSRDGAFISGYTLVSPEQMTTDLCCATTVVDDCNLHPDVVPLVFSHKLSQVVVRVKAEADYSTPTNTVSLVLTSLSFNGVRSVGDLVDGTWVNQRSKHSYPLMNEVLPLTYDPEGGYQDICRYVFLPQSLANDATLSVGCRIVQNVSGTEYSLDNPPVSIPLNHTLMEWEPGKKYIYSLSVGMNNLITFTATTTDWADDGGGLVVE